MIFHTERTNIPHPNISIYAEDERIRFALPSRYTVFL